MNDVVTNHEAGQEVFDRIKIEYGVFGEAHPKIVEMTGVKCYNFKLTVNWNKHDPSDTWDEFGVVSQDGAKIYFKSETNSEEVEIHELISQAEVDEIENEIGDPISNRRTSRSIHRPT